jgi:2-oxoglutarate ferredoxin oxidoreductase subunit alpha
MDSRGTRQRNLVKSLFLDPTELNNQNLLLKAKYDQMQRDEVMYEAYNLDCDYQALIVSYGTMSRVCRTAIDNFKAEGLEVAMIRPQTVFPYPIEEVRRTAGKPGCKVVVSVEMNMGQMLEDVERSVQGQRPVGWYGKCGGEVPTPEEVMDAVRTQMAAAPQA